MISFRRIRANASGQEFSEITLRPDLLSKIVMPVYPDGRALSKRPGEKESSVRRRQTFESLKLKTHRPQHGFVRRYEPLHN